MDGRFELTERDYRYLFENASDAIWVHDLNGYILDGNRAFERLSGFATREWAGVNVARSLTTEESLTLAREVRRKLLAGEEIEQPYEQRFVRKDGTVRIVKMATSPVIIDGIVKGYQHVARDVTEEKQVQESMRYYVQQVTRAQEDERKRIARELHDEVSPSVLLLIQRLDAITSGSKPKLSRSLEKELEDLRRQAVETLEGLRRCAQDLRPRILDDLGLVAALEWMTDDMAKSQGIDANAEIVGKERTLPAETQLLLFRIAQEALSNIRRHARATKAVVKLEFGDNNITMAVIDNGKGFEVPKRTEDLASAGRFGVMGMHERARLLRGTLNMKSDLGKGTQVVVQVPSLQAT